MKQYLNITSKSQKSPKSQKFKKSFLIFLLTGILLITAIDIAHAGMPSVILTDIAKLRLSTISFFLFTYLAASWGIWGLWNWLQTDFDRLPRLSFTKALALVFLWGLAFHLILVMIAGTRELMTPEAWEKAGVIHKLSPDKFEQLVEMRRYNLQRLKNQIWPIAEKNQGKFPTKQELLAISPDIFLDPTGQSAYNYLEGLSITVNSPPSVLAYEPDSYGQERMVLFTNGSIELFSFTGIQKLMENNINQTQPTN
jgi:hypothetical protein